MPATICDIIDRDKRTVQRVLKNLVDYELIHYLILNVNNEVVLFEKIDKGNIKKINTKNGRFIKN